MKVIIDAFGGDNAPLEILKGSEMAIKEYDVDIILTGDEEKIKECAKENNISLDRMEIIHADEIISMHDEPRCVVKAKSNSSMAVGLKALSEGKGEAFISAGSTGALVFGSTFIVKRLKGVKRAAFGSAIPTVKGGYFFLMDEGANVDCRPEMLLQFAIMASTYVSCVYGVENPRVGLLNIGTEDTKGGQLQLDTYKLLEKADINFIGNVEARELMNGVCDVVVTDGFSGNICLKLIEGVAMSMMKLIKGVFMKNLKTKIAAAMVMPGMKKIKKMMDYTEIGGAPVIGVRKLVFKAHGNSNALAFKNAIGNAVVSVKAGMIEKLAENLNDTSENDENE